MNDYSSPFKIEYESKYDDIPRNDLIELIINPPVRVLEIGCGSGATGASIKQKYIDTEYIGVELDQKAAQFARSRLDKVITGDIEKINLEQFGLHKEHFGLIICADILEHLYDPWKTLSRLKDYLEPCGKIVASIPNVQNIRIISHLIYGYWTYKDCGILDAAHIRFFTINEIIRMFSETGYKLINCIPKLAYKVENEGWPKDLEIGRILIKNVSEEEAIRLYTYQYLLTAQKN